MSRVIRSSNRLRATSSPVLAVAAILGVVSFVGAAMQMQMQKKGGSVVSITTSMVDHPLVGVTASVPMITKGGIESISKNLTMEYAKEGIRFNTVAPGVVDTPLHKDNPKDFLRTLSAMGSISDAQEIVDAVVFLAEAPDITGKVL